MPRFFNIFWIDLLTLPIQQKLVILKQRAAWRKFYRDGSMDGLVEAGLIDASDL